MTTESTRVVERDEILIDDHRYKVTGAIRQSLLNRPPGKITIGDYTDASNPMASEFSLGDFRDGIGVERGDISAHTGRVWFATGQIRYRDAYILGRRAVLTAAGPTAEVQTLTIFKNELYGTYGTAVHLYDNSGDSWGSSIRTLASNATDAKVGILFPGGTATETLVIANGTDVDYATDSSTWAENTGQAIKYLIFWGDLLWGITNAGRLYFTDDLSATWSEDAQLPLPAGSVTGLEVARGPDRESHIYAVTKQGLYVHDRANARFLPTDLELPEHIDGGKGHEVWRASIYTSAGNAVYGFQAGSDTTDVGVVGPDLDDGLPDGKRGTINKLIGSHNELFAFLDASSAQGVSGLSTRVSRGVRFHHGVTFPATSGFSLILGWNARGWETKWLSGETARSISAGVVGTAYNTYRLWWAANQRVYYMTLPVDVVNPLQIPTQQYESEAVLETPWFDMGIRNQQKLALASIVDTIHPSTSETVKIEYATNLEETYTTIATKSETGEVEYRLPSSVDSTGVPFRWWKWRITLARGSTNTNTPQLVRITLVWRPRTETIYRIDATLDLTKDYAGLPVNQQLKNLRDSLNSGKLIRITFRADPVGNLTYLMDPLDESSDEEGGPTSYGTVRVAFGEPLSTHSDPVHERA